MKDNRIKIKSKGDRLWLLVLLVTFFNVCWQLGRQLVVMVVAWNAVATDMSVWGILVLDLLGVAGVLWFLRKYLNELKAKKAAESTGPPPATPKADPNDYEGKWKP